ncbi:transposase [Magnetofaba australis]|uniref:transposase n=1 Tax=Magnetofaba australis TaxID=1472297 RepID=UPI00117CD5DA|nr:transposase [Magnetofaba australis]
MSRISRLPHIDYHIELEGHYYSVPHALARKRLDIRYTANTVECFHRGKRVASHPRNHVKGRHTTTSEHMPESHRRHAHWTPSRIISWAHESGPHVAKLATHIIENRPHPEQGFRSCLGIIRLAKKYGSERVDAACARALAIGGPTYKSVKSILQSNLDQQPLPESDPTTPSIQHNNLRGAGYFH